ncbi:MAG: putative pseudouridine synthase yhcT [Chlamydiota bacterium]
MDYRIEKEMPLLGWLQKEFPDSSNRTLRLWVKTGRIQVDGQVISRADTLLAPLQKISIGPKVSVGKGGLPIIYQDPHLIVINKPEGLLSVATDFDDTANAHTFLKQELYPKRVFPVHRLDRETSGVMLFALTEETKEAIKMQFEKRVVEKTYLALVEGSFDVLTGRFESYLQEDQNYHVRSAPTGKLSVTDYEVIRQNHRRALLRLKPLTGRKHQLRVQCSDAGHPIIGDKRYGGEQDVERLYLHAQSIRLTHPVTHRPLSFSVPVPSAFSLDSVV